MSLTQVTPTYDEVVAKLLVANAPTPVIADEWAACIDEGAENGRGPVWALLHRGVPRLDIERAVFRAAGYEIRAVTRDAIHDQTLDRLTIRTARDLGIVPLRSLEGAGLVLGVTDPLNLEALDKGRAALGTGLTERPVLVDRNNLNTVLAQIEQADTFADTADDPGEFDDEDTPVAEVGADSKLLARARALIEGAYRSRASDVHLEPVENGLRVRYRVDQHAHHAVMFSAQEGARLVQAFKILGKMDLAATRVSQNGRAHIELAGASLDLRLMSHPTPWDGREGVVIRILDQSAARRSLTDLGIATDHLVTWRRLLRMNTGLLLVCGPTNSGKTTTMYASLSERSGDDTVIFSAEDPVEYRFTGVNQVQIERAAGMTFAKAIEDFLRGDPDVILVGETRDPDTATMSVTAALTGHLVISSVHTNDSATAAARLIDMGVEPFRVASTLRAALSQRLVRRVCRACRRSVVPTDHDLGVAQWQMARPSHVYEPSPNGCAACGNTGYTGLIAVNELLVVNSEIADLIAHGATAADLNLAAKKAGMRTLLEDGQQRVAEGITTLSEISKLAASIESTEILDSTGATQ